MGRDFLIVGEGRENRVECLELMLRKGHFQHLTGARTKASGIPPDEFFDRCAESRLSQDDLDPDVQGHVALKLRAARQLFAPGLPVTAFGRGNHSHLLLQADSAVGSKSGVLGLKRIPGGLHVPMTLLDASIRDEVVDRHDVVAVFSKRLDEAGYGIPGTLRETAFGKPIDWSEVRKSLPEKWAGVELSRREVFVVESPGHSTVAVSGRFDCDDVLVEAPRQYLLFRLERSRIATGSPVAEQLAVPRERPFRGRLAVELDGCANAPDAVEPVARGKSRYLRSIADVSGARGYHVGYDSRFFVVYRVELEGEIQYVAALGEARKAIRYRRFLPSRRRQKQQGCDYGRQVRMLAVARVLEPDPVLASLVGQVSSRGEGRAVQEYRQSLHEQVVDIMGTIRADDLVFATTSGRHFPHAERHLTRRLSTHARCYRHDS